jgi:hypothetical protein
MPFGPGTYPAGDPRNAQPAQGTMTPLRLGAQMQAPVKPAMPGSTMVPQRPLNQPMPQAAPMGAGLTPETQMLRAPAVGPQGVQPAMPGQMAPRGRMGGKSARAPGQFMQQQ